MKRTPLTVSLAVVILGEFATPCHAQIRVFPSVQNFDSVQPPALPPGWTSSQNRTAGTNDFTTSTTTPRSSPNAAGSTNATVAQWLISPLVNFGDLSPDSLQFFVRRSATHNARMLVEASLDSGRSYPVRLSDSLGNTLPNSYLQVKLSLLPLPPGNRAVKFRWRTVADASGNTGTLRLDDITVTAMHSADIALAGIRFQPQFPEGTDSVTAIVKIKNTGQQSAENFRVECYVDANNDSIPQPAELRGTAVHVLPLAPRDSVDLSVSIGMLPGGQQQIIVKAVYPPDQNLSNNQDITVITVGSRQERICVNEVMYGPASPEPEWVEVHNTGGSPVNLKNWLVSNRTTSARKVISSSNLFIPGGGYAVLTKDSAGFMEVHPDIHSQVINVTGFPTLNNNGDAVVLFDARGAIHDSAGYLPSWGGRNGFSLERIDPFGPSTLQTNWGTSRSASRSTPGDRNTLTRKDRDLAVDSVTTDPKFPAAGEALSVLAVIRNAGRETPGSFGVQLFRDANGDSLPQPAELIASLVHAVPLAPLDSVTVSLPVSGIQPGSHLFIVRVDFPADEDTTNNRKTARVVAGYPQGTVCINEVVFAPSAGVPEWVELYNNHADTVDLNKWIIGNRLTSSRYEITSRPVLLAPEEYAVVTKDTALLRAAYPLIGGTAIQTSALPTFLWNNSADAVVLADNRKVITDSMYYKSTWGGAHGKSIERIDPSGDPNDSTNWATSQDSAGATPGRKNTQALLENDLRIARVLSDTVRPGSDAHLRIVVQNAGREPSGAFDLVLFDDADADSAGVPGEQFHTQRITQSLAWRESTTVAITWHSPPSGMRRLIAEVRYPPDQRTSNNKGFGIVRVGYPGRTLVINEIMYAPFAQNAEYVEFCNPGSEDVDLNQWSFHRRAASGTPKEVRLSDSSRVIHPGEYFVVASDSTVYRLLPAGMEKRLLTVLRQSSLSLNNNGDDIVLTDGSGFVIDSVGYSPSWHNPGVTDKTGRALEKIHPALSSNDPRSWTTCTRQEGGTPGRQNSVYAATLPSQSKLSISPNPFSPDGDGHDDFALIQFEMPLTVSSVRVRIFDSLGRNVRTLSNNEPGSSRGSIVWDGLDDERQKVRIGIYIVLLEAINERGGVVESAKGVVVVAARL